MTTTTATAPSTDFDAFAAQSAAAVDALRKQANLGTPQALLINEIDAIVWGHNIAGHIVAEVADRCCYCGTEALPLADSTTGRRPFPHHGFDGTLCVFGTIIEDTALTADVTAHLR